MLSLLLAHQQHCQGLVPISRSANVNYAYPQAINMKVRLLENVSLPVQQIQCDNYVTQIA